MSTTPLWFRERPDFLLPNFFENVKEHMDLEPFQLTSIWTNEHGWEELVYEHEEKKKTSSCISLEGDVKSPV